MGVCSGAAGWGGARVPLVPRCAPHGKSFRSTGCCPAGRHRHIQDLAGEERERPSSQVSDSVSEWLVDHTNEPLLKVLELLSKTEGQIATTLRCHTYQEVCIPEVLGHGAPCQSPQGPLLSCLQHTHTHKLKKGIAEHWGPCNL